MQAETMGPNIARSALIIVDMQNDFASAAPVMDFAYELKRVELAHVPDEAKVLMLTGNVTRLFGLEGESR